MKKHNSPALFQQASNASTEPSENEPETGREKRNSARRGLRRIDHIDDGGD